nr:aminoacetone oxidase family FAD-binding enzyme [Candidatus Gracilibacteria bacterium]
MIYDFVIIGGGATGLFSSIFAPSNSKKVILEKNNNPGVKVLLSGGERANITNINIDPQNDYFGQNKKAMISILKRFSQYDTISFFEEGGIRTVEEDRGRIILESGDSKELLNFLLKKSKENNTEIKTNFEVINIEKRDELFYISSSLGEEVIGKKVLVSAGGKSFFQVGTKGDSYVFAEKFGLNMVNPYRALSAFVLNQDLSLLSGVSLNVNLDVLDKITGKNIYSEFGPLLFTHFGISGPIVFNASSALGSYINKTYNSEEQGYLNILIKLNFNVNNTPKRVVKFFNLTEENRIITLNLQNLRSWKEAKLTGGGVLLDNLDNNLQSKTISGLYFAGECLDITGKTGGFSLQLAWSSGFIVGKDI